MSPQPTLSIFDKKNQRPSRRRAVTLDAGTLGSTARQSERRRPFNHLQGWTGWMDAWDHPPAAENGRRDVVQVPRYANSSRIWKTTTTTLETTLMARDPHPYPLTPGSDQHLAVCWPAVSFRNLRCHLIRGGQAQPPHPASYIMSYPTSPGCLSSGGGAPSPTGSCRNKAPGGAVGRHTKRPGRPITANGSIVVVEILDVQKFARLWPLLLLLLTARRWREQTAWALAVWREQGRLPA